MDTLTKYFLEILGRNIKAVIFQRHLSVAASLVKRTNSKSLLIMKYYNKNSKLNDKLVSYYNLRYGV